MQTVARAEILNLMKEVNHGVRSTQIDRQEIITARTIIHLMTKLNGKTYVQVTLNREATVKRCFHRHVRHRREGMRVCVY